MRSIGRSIRQHEGTLHSYGQVVPTGTRIVTEGFNELAIPVQVKIEDVPKMVGEELKSRLDQIADAVAREQSGLFYKKIDESTKEVGTAIHGGGKPFTKEMWLQMFEAMQIDFDEKTHKPEFTIVAHPTMAETMAKLWTEWEQDPEFMRRYKELQDMKYEEWRDRESRRKLVD